MTTFRPALLSFLACVLLPSVTLAAEVAVNGDQILVDGKETKLWGIRVASASQTDAYTDHLIAQLDDYKANGLNAVTVFFQGSNAGCADPFNPAGTTLDPAHLARMERIIRACDQRGMVVVVGIFYQVKAVQGVMPPVNLRDWVACKEAVRTVTRGLRGHRNIILNIANEQNSAGHAQHPWAPVRTAAGLIEACEIVREEDSSRLVGAGGYNHDINVELGRSPAVDILLFDTLGPDRQKSSGHWYDHFIANGVTGKPIVNVEMFGNWTGQFKPPGVYTDEGKRIHFQEIDDAVARPALSMFFHSNNWCQGAFEGFPVRYDLGGDGTADAPGIRWYVDYLQRRLAEAKARR